MQCIGGWLAGGMSLFERIRQQVKEVPIALDISEKPLVWLGNIMPFRYSNFTCVILEYWVISVKQLFNSEWDSII